MAKLGEQRDCRLLLSPCPCWAAPQTFPPGFPAGACPGKLRGAAGTGAALRQPGRPARICLPFAVLPCAGQASAGEPRHCEWQSRDGQSAALPARGGGTRTRRGTGDSRRARRTFARHLRRLQQRRDPPVAAGGANRSCGGRELEAVGDGRSAGSPAAAFQQSAACFHSFPCPVPRPPVPGSGRGASPAPLSGAPAGPAGGNAAPAGAGRGAGPQYSRSQAKMLCDASSPLPSHFVALFIFLNKLLVIYGLCLAFSSLPPATC